MNGNIFLVLRPSNEIKSFGKHTNAAICDTFIPVHIHVHCQVSVTAVLKRFQYTNTISSLIVPFTYIKDIIDEP